MTEEELVRQIQQGNRDAFRTLLEQYQQHVFHVAYSVVRDRNDAEDVTQEVFFQIHRSLSQYEFKGLKTWISRIALNKAIDYKRKQNRIREDHVEDVEVAVNGEPLVHSSLHQDVALQVLQKDRKDRLRWQLENIPETHRDIIHSYYLEEKSYDTIAKEKDISVKTVESRLYRARNWLRTHWKEEDW